jgi:hypothetical protein
MHRVGDKGRRGHAGFRAVVLFKSSARRRPENRSSRYRPGFGFGRSALALKTREHFISSAKPQVRLSTEPPDSAFRGGREGTEDQ